MPAPAASLEPPPLAIVSGRVIPVASAPIEDGTVLLRGGRIEAVGADISVPSDAEVIDAAGRWVLPGFIEAHAHAGIHEESSGGAGDDTNESSAPVLPGLRALDAINIEDPGFDDALHGGITTVIVKPGSSNVFGGQTVALKTAGGPTVDDRILSDAVSLKSAFGENPTSAHGGSGRTPMTRMGIAMLIRQTLEDARHYRARRDIAASEGAPFAVDLGQETLVRLLEGELIWDVHAHRHDDIASALRIAEEYGLRLVINHGTEAYKLVDRIAERGLPVIVGPTLSARTKVELQGSRASTPAALTAAGVQVALITDHPQVPIHLLRVQAAVAVRAGLGREDAMRAITSTPAEIYGLQDRVGSLRPGADADVVIWSGDPLDLQSQAMHVIIAGQTAHLAGGAA
ncbi:amidohydrolase [Microbacterium trichothecenolyticum]|uniref:amidohydrolase n=1 Tax=Microbacterium trichothecenolyticum TaxID=69370 RepID=UPI001C6F3025|nr:amidohydrolase [Microbacterium trichothecenolyticum]MBW9119301.1 amidohydrolase [Microbacterium trichothecenolyticum]